MMTSQVSTTINTPVKQPQATTLYSVLRSHSLGELQLMDVKELQAAKLLISARIELIYSRIKTVNLFFSQIDELRTDIRWYLLVELEIDALLAAEFHSK
ncbi:hypothetical protein [Spirosoma lituiforme]